MANLQGAAWLIHESHSTFAPDDFTEEQLLVKDLCRNFLETRVLPIAGRLDAMEPGLMQSLLEEAGEAGLLGVSVPEAYGGLGKDFVTSTLVSEGLGGGFSFSVAVSAHTGIGILPILYFGTEAQKLKYIPKLASGEWKGAYGLTEPGSGSDALSAKTTAHLTADGKDYLLNGQKIWITNGGFADVFTIFAKVDGAHFTAFIVEKGMQGFAHGPEEHKMGIKGSSTVQLFFEDCRVPAANVLGSVGKGHIIAFNILNIGRLKLCAATVGGAKRALNHSIQYALNRQQFGEPIGNFGAIKHKLAEMAIRSWACESALYRTAKWIDEKEEQLLNEGQPFSDALLGAAEEFAIECAMLKVLGSETLDFVVDEGVQIHGGNGYSDEYVISRAYRDSRINRIFEGTNEINRLLIIDIMLKRSLKGRLQLLQPALAIQKELLELPGFSGDVYEDYGKEKNLVTNFKKAVLLLAAAAVQKFGVGLQNEQEIVMQLANMVIDTFTAESALLRLMKKQNGHDRQNFENSIVQVFLSDAADRMFVNGKQAINAFALGDDQRLLLLGLKRFTKMEPLNTKELRRRIADKLLSDGFMAL